MPNPQDADDALKLAALHTQIVMQWIKDLGHDPSVDSLAIGAITATSPCVVCCVSRTSRSVGAYLPR